jgi:hypothetical protein
VIKAISGLILILAAAQSPTVPKVWDDTALETFEMPLANPESSAKHARSDYYYRITERPIYKSYPVYAPGKEPEGYLQWLEQQEPQIAFDPTQLKSTDDWVAAGEIVFDAPIGYGSTFKLSQLRDPQWYEKTGTPVTSDGIMPFSRYVIRKKGTVEVGSGSCLMCHARVMPDGSVVKGAQGNFPTDRVLAFNMRQQAKDSSDPPALLSAIKSGQRAFFSAPWLRPNPIDRIDAMSMDEIIGVYESIPPGTTTRINLSLFAPAQIPDLIGIKDIRHLDHTGVVVQSSIDDLMRYVALVQGANAFDHFGDFALIENLPDPTKLERYSDAQLFAVAQYLYSLKAPANPNRTDERAKRGQTIFGQEGCDVCHTPPLYTSNKLTPVDGFTPPAEHLRKYGIIERSVGTDTALALRTRKGTGYYKIPSLRGVWYRGPLEHRGSVNTLEEWFDPQRRERVAGHPFGLALSVEDRAALIAFLRTL